MSALPRQAEANEPPPRRTLRVAFVSTDFRPDPGGVAEVGLRLCEGLAARGHAIHALVHRGRQLPAPHAEVTDRFPVHRAFPSCPCTSTTSPRKYLAVRRWTGGARASVLEFLRRAPVDAVLFGNYHATLTAAVARGLRVPYFLFLHGEDVSIDVHSRNPMRSVRLRRTIRGAAWTFTNSHYSLAQARRLAGALPRGSAVGCGFPAASIPERRDPLEARRALGIEGGPVLLTMARLSPRKGFDTVIQALPALLERRPGLLYLMAGSGSAEPFLRQAAELGVADHVRYMGFVDEPTKARLYEAADVYVMPSKPGRSREVEGFGISFLEANAHGLPVVGSTVGGIPDAVADDVNGLLVPPDNPQALAIALRQLLDDPPRGRAMALAGQERIRTRFNWEAIAGNVEQTMLRALGDE